MNNDTNKSALPSLISDVLTDQYQCIDNLFANTWKTLRLNTLLRSAGFSKRSGLQVTQAVFLLLLWKWLAVSSIAMFSRKAMGTFCDAKKDGNYSASGEKISGSVPENSIDKAIVALTRCLRQLIR